MSFLHMKELSIFLLVIVFLLNCNFLFDNYIAINILQHYVRLLTMVS